MASPEGLIGESVSSVKSLSSCMKSSREANGSRSGSADPAAVDAVLDVVRCIVSFVLGPASGRTDEFVLLLSLEFDSEFAAVDVDEVLFLDKLRVLFFVVDVDGTGTALPLPLSLFGFFTYPWSLRTHLTTYLSFIAYPYTFCVSF